MSSWCSPRPSKPLSVAKLQSWVRFPGVPAICWKSYYIVTIPIGLDTPEGVLVGNIDSLKMENGMVPVINSAVKYFYQNGEFLANDSDWMDEYDDFKYNDYAIMQEEYKYEGNQENSSAILSSLSLWWYTHNDSSLLARRGWII